MHIPAAAERSGGKGGAGLLLPYGVEDPSDGETLRNMAGWDGSHFTSGSLRPTTGFKTIAVLTNLL